MRKLAPLRVQAFCPECGQQAFEWIHPRLWRPLVDLDPDVDAWLSKCHAPGCAKMFWIKVRAIHRARPDIRAA